MARWPAAVLAKLDFPPMQFSLYFLGYERAQDIPDDPVERVRCTRHARWLACVVWHTRARAAADTRARAPWCDAALQARWMFGRPAVLELTHNWGTESDPSFAGYHAGNSEPRGFGHIGLAVPDVYAAAKRFEECVRGRPRVQAWAPLAARPCV